MKDTGSNETTGLEAPLISATSAWLLGGLLLVLFAAGSVWDRQISEALFDPTVLVDPTAANPVGLFGAAYGEVPLGLGFVAAGVLLLESARSSRGWGTVLRVALGAVSFLLGGFLVFYLPTRYLAWPGWVIVVVGLGLIFGATFLVLKVSQNTQPSRAVRVAVVIIVVAAAELAIVNLAKLGWQRPRMRMLEELAASGDGTLSFSHWWDPGTPERSELIASGVTKAEEFKSFPSGHTANAATLILLTTLPALRRSLQKWSGWLFWVGATWALYVALSRIIMGAHFLTDVTTGLAVTFVIILVVYRFAFPVKKADELVGEPGSLK